MNTRLLCCGLGLVLLAGCKGDGLRSAKTRTDSADPAPHLNRSQVADVKYAVGRSMEARGDHARAKAAYSEAAEGDPKRVDALARMAVVLDREGKCKESEPLYKKALAANPGDPDLHCNRGYSLYLQNRYAEAEDHFRKALTLEPRHARARNNLGLVFARQGKAEDALESFTLAGCSAVDAHTNLAYGLMMAGDTERAKRHYETALHLDPNCPTARKGAQTLVALNERQAKRAGNLAQSPPAPPADPGVVRASHTVPVTVGKPKQ